MLSRLLTSVLGSRNQRVLRQLWKTVGVINALEPRISSLTNADLRQKTSEFRIRLQKGETVDDLLPEAFAVVRETAKRTLGLRHFDVQLIGGMVLHGGNIAEMRTGEGKTLMSTLAVYLNALPEKGVNLVTVNDYLAKRDAVWMSPIYEFLGLTVGVIHPNMPLHDKQKAYAADITYGTNNEFGFDYLRDNMVFNRAEKMQRAPYYAIVDEVDSILIDEARTPLIISGPSGESIELYTIINDLVPQLSRQKESEGSGDYSIDEKSKQVYITEEGHQRIEDLFTQAGLIKLGESLYDANNIILVHHLNAALRAHALFHRDIEYIIQNNEAIIVDEHTGRTMPGRRWSDGLHQAIEAKEGVQIHQENQTLASITFQNYFRLYEKLAGMTGTADTEAYEFQQIYGLEVVVVPTHKDMIRADLPDFVFIGASEKFTAIVNDIKTTYKTGQPVLVGTTSIETSEYLSRLLQKENIPHQVLNAKFHEKEAQIIAEAGRPRAVTIATNMAGRGTDIVLGGKLESELKSEETLSEEEIEKRKQAWQEKHNQVVMAGGLYVLGTERHESRRIDNQLRGRSGRQGDPGKSRFYLSLEDNLLRIFGGERLRSLMQRIGVEKGVALESRMLSRSIENAQRKVEAYNFDIRKQLLEYDDVANEQRKVIYHQRDELLASADISDTIDAIRTRVAATLADTFCPPQMLEEQWNIQELEKCLETDFNVNLSIQAWLKEEETLDDESLKKCIYDALTAVYRTKEAKAPQGVMRQFEQAVMLQTVDKSWREHLAAMDYLRQGIHLRGYAQKNPKQEYKRESFELFSQMLDKINHDVVSILNKFEVQSEENIEKMEVQNEKSLLSRDVKYQHVEMDALHQIETAVTELEEKNSLPIPELNTYMRTEHKVGRNDLCHCGSGKKYKRCHGALS